MVRRNELGAHAIAIFGWFEQEKSADNRLFSTLLATDFRVNCPGTVDLWIKKQLANGD
jgi:hypothetical protein